MVPTPMIYWDLSQNSSSACHCSMKKMIIKKYLLVTTVNSLTLCSSRVLKPCHKLWMVSCLSRSVLIRIWYNQENKRSGLWGGLKMLTTNWSLHCVSSQDLLKKCYSAEAAYLFQQDKFYDVSYDTGDKSIQCSRRPDAFKFWLMWKALGTTGLEERVNRALALARYHPTVLSMSGLFGWHCWYSISWNRSHSYILPLSFCLCIIGGTNNNDNYCYYVCYNI